MKERAGGKCRDSVIHAYGDWDRCLWSCCVCLWGWVKQPQILHGGAACGSLVFKQRHSLLIVLLTHSQESLWRHFRKPASVQWWLRKWSECKGREQVAPPWAVKSRCWNSSIPWQLCRQLLTEPLDLRIPHPTEAPGYFPWGMTRNSPVCLWVVSKLRTG